MRGRSAARRGRCFQIEAFLVLIILREKQFAVPVYIGGSHVLGFDAIAWKRYNTRPGMPSSIFLGFLEPWNIGSGLLCHPWYRIAERLAVSGHTTYCISGYMAFRAY